MKRYRSIVFLAVGLSLSACAEEEGSAEHNVTPKEPGGADQSAGALSPTPTAADRQLLNDVQQQTFRYFWDSAHPVSGLARERSSSGDIVTIGGSGFGVQAILVATHRGWITRAAALDRVTKIVNFLGTADRFHGAFSHWINGSTGRVIPFSPNDNGGDLIETAFMINGLLAARSFFNGTATGEVALRQQITQLWEAVEWSWYASRGDNNMYWHWSPTAEWAMNVPIRGWNEGLVAYILALGSPTHPISPAVYQNAWTNQGYANNATYEGYDLQIGEPLGGPLFFTHYSFMSINPAQMEDKFTNYWQHNVKHALVNRAYSVNSAPKDFGYTGSLWGLTASDDPDGYSAHSPTNDDGTFTPTAALSSFPYTPFYSMQVLRNLYGGLKAQLVGPEGPYDAYNKSRNWVGRDYLAIDQGPIVVMIENYRSGLPWSLVTGLPEVQAGMAKAGIHKPALQTGFPLAVLNVQLGLLDVLKHPDLNAYPIDVAIGASDNWTLSLLRNDGTVAQAIWTNLAKAPGQYRVTFGAAALPGVYRLRLTGGGLTKELRVNLH